MDKRLMQERADMWRTVRWHVCILKNVEEITGNIMGFPGGSVVKNPM